MHYFQVNAQALSCGLPLVITDAPGNVDAGKHGGALIARTGDVDSMADCLARLVHDPSARQKLGGEAHQASRRYAWQHIAEEYLAIFEELLDGRGHVAPAYAGRPGSIDPTLPSGERS